MITLRSSVPWGAFQAITTTYAAYVTPLVLRPILTAYVNICWVAGQVIATGVLRGILPWESQWAYRLPFALQCTFESCLELTLRVVARHHHSWNTLCS